MKTLILKLFVVTLLPFRAEETQSVEAISEALRTSKIPKLELNEATFGDAMAMVRDEWERQHPKLDFPVASAEYKDAPGYPSLITMSLREVPFIKALQFIGEITGRRLIKRSNLLILADYAAINKDWFTKSHEASDKLLTALGVGKDSSGEELRAAYARYGVKFADWMKIGYGDGFIILFAVEKQHEQIAGINVLLSQGFKITKPEKK